MSKEEYELRDIISEELKLQLQRQQIHRSNSGTLREFFTSSGLEKTSWPFFSRVLLPNIIYVCYVASSNRRTPELAMGFERERFSILGDNSKQ